MHFALSDNANQVSRLSNKLVGAAEVSNAKPRQRLLHVVIPKLLQTLHRAGTQAPVTVRIESNAGQVGLSVHCPDGVRTLLLQELQDAYPGLLGCGLTPADLMAIPKYHAYLRLLVAEAPHTFSMTTLPPPKFNKRRAGIVRKISRQLNGGQ